MADTRMGSAQFGDYEGEDIDRVFAGDLIGIGCNTNNKNKYYWFKPETHLTTVARTRSGKGATLIIPNLLHYRGSTLVIDPKGENAYITAKRRRELGQKTYILDPWGEVNRRYGSKSGEMEEIATFNPLSLLDLESPDYMDDLAYIADSLIINQGKDPHWDDSARELVTGLISYVMESIEEPSLYDVKTLLSKSIKEIAGIATVAQELNSEEKDSLAARKLARFIIATKENASILSTAQTQTSILDNPALAENMKTSSFSFDELTQGGEGVTIYLVLPVDKLQTYGRWLRLMISIGIRTISRNTEKLDYPVLFILDEFGTIGKLSAVAQAVGLMAGLQVCLWLFLQDINQLKRDYPHEWETFIGNSGAVTVLDIMDNTTTRYFSEMLGTATEERISETTADIRKGNLFKSGNPDYMKMTDQIFSRPLMTADELRAKPPALGILIKNTFDPDLYERVPYFKNPFFYMKARQDPYHPDPRGDYEGLLADISNFTASLQKEEKFDVNLLITKGEELIKKTSQKEKTQEEIRADFLELKSSYDKEKHKAQVAERIEIAKESTKKAFALGGQLFKKGKELLDKDEKS